VAGQVAVQRSFQNISQQRITSHVYQVLIHVYTRSDVTLDSADYSAAAMPVLQTVQRPRPSALNRPPAQAQAIAHASTSHSADPASCDGAQPPDPLPILQPSGAADTASMDNVSGDNAAQNSPLAPAN
jgi:hypothetical protein